jgi:hypothetical protein
MNSWTVLTSKVVFLPQRGGINIDTRFTDCKEAGGQGQCSKTGFFVDKGGRNSGSAKNMRNQSRVSGIGMTLPAQKWQWRSAHCRARAEATARLMIFSRARKACGLGNPGRAARRMVRDDLPASGSRTISRRRKESTASAGRRVDP